jgi:hypothetical protein
MSQVTLCHSEYNRSYTVTRQQLSSCHLFSGLLSDYKDLQSIPIPDNTPSTVMDDYVNFITKTDMSRQHLKQCLEFAHLIDDRKYFQHLISILLKSWSSCDYKTIVDELNDDLKEELYYHFPHELLPQNISDNILRNTELRVKWLTNINGRSIYVDDTSYYHFFRIGEDGNYTVYHFKEHNISSHNS